MKNSGSGPIKHVSAIPVDFRCAAAFCTRARTVCAGFHEHHAEAVQGAGKRSAGVHDDYRLGQDGKRVDADGVIVIQPITAPFGDREAIDESPPLGLFP